ncbi:MAG: DUF6294 family protein (plasmid) [Leptolyngbya sp. BL-A-14]
MNMIKKTGLFATLGLLTAINCVGLLPNLLPGAKAMASNVPSKTFRFNTLHAGDCQMLNPTLTFNSDGSGQFTAKALTLHTHSGDKWHIRFVVKNRTGVELFQLGQWDGPRMDDGNPPPVYTFSQPFSYNQLNFGVMSNISVSARC